MSKKLRKKAAANRPEAAWPISKIEPGDRLILQKSDVDFRDKIDAVIRHTSGVMLAARGMEEILGKSAWGPGLLALIEAHEHLLRGLRETYRQISVHVS
jgi:hypothetical protein